MFALRELHLSRMGRGQEREGFQLDYGNGKKRIERLDSRGHIFRGLRSVSFVVVCRMMNTTGVGYFRCETRDFCCSIAPIHSSNRILGKYANERGDILNLFGRFDPKKRIAGCHTEGVTPLHLQFENAKMVNLKFNINHD